MAESAKTEETPAIPKEKMEVVYTSAGQEVKLNAAIVRNYIAKGNTSVTDIDIAQFISLCKYNELNPFLNESYLVKFGDKPAQMIVSKEAFMKRAEACSAYEGYQAGLIIKRGNEVVEEEGSFSLPEDVVIGGWARVVRSDRKFPIVGRVSMAEYNKKQSLWNEKPSTMIRKVALVQALREAFPAQLGAMYTPEEASVEDISYEEVKASVKKEIVEKSGKKEMTMSLPEKQANPLDQLGKQKLEAEKVPVSTAKEKEKPKAREAKLPEVPKQKEAHEVNEDLRVENDPDMPSFMQFDDE